MKIFSLIFLIYPILSKIPENAFINLAELTQENFCGRYILKLKSQEYIFHNEGTYSIIILIIGCFLTLYGAYYNFFMIFESTLFLYYIISMFISCNEEKGETDFRRNLLFILYFALITGVILFIVYKLQIKLINKNIYIKKIFYGMFSGCFLCEIIFHFIYSFNNEYNSDIYYILFPIIIVVAGLGTIFIPDKIFSIPCSVISGSFFIQLSIDNLLNDPYEIKTVEKILSLIAFIVIVIISFIYQIYHLRRKKNELPSFINEVQTTIKKNLDISQSYSDPQSLNNTNSMEMVDKDNRDSYKNNEGDTTQDNNIIDDQDG